MKSRYSRVTKMLLACVSVASLIQDVYAAPFAYNYGDLILCCRKIGGTDDLGDPRVTSAYSFEVNLGPASQFYNATSGSTVSLTPGQFSATQIAAVFGGLANGGLNDLYWSVSGYVDPSATGSSFPAHTLWVTAPRLDPDVQADPWVRNSANNQANVDSTIRSILEGARLYSATIPPDANFNTATVVRVLNGTGDPGTSYDFGSFMGTSGDYSGTFQGDVENITSHTFDSDGLPCRSDLYELLPTTSKSQNGTPGIYLGYFELNADGSLIFVASTGPTVAAPTVTAQSASEQTASGATLNANINPNGAATTFWFQYGTTTSYGSVTATNSLSSGTTGVAVNAAVSGLLPGTTYHFQAVANNSGGTATGSDLAFATLTVVQPQLGAVKVLSGGAVQFAFTNATGASFKVWGTTNVALPFNQWSNLGHPTETTPGQYQFSDPQASGYSRRFYRISQP
jgi:hypothetical protein